MLWIALHLPDLPLQVFTRGVADPGVLAVVDHRPRQHLVAASPAAFALGVEPGAGKYDTTRGHPPRPAWLLPEPRPLASIRALELLCGPERIASGWWDGKDVCRDYFIARTPDAAMWWIFRRLDQSQGWFLHGYFG